MATNVDPGTPPRAPVVRDLSPYPTDYKIWKVLAWTGPVFLAAFLYLRGLRARNIPPFPPSGHARRGLAALRGPQTSDHDRDERLPHDGRLLHVVERGHRPGDGTY